jgi:flagellar protein FliL
MSEDAPSRRKPFIKLLLLGLLALLLLGVLGAGGRFVYRKFTAARLAKSMVPANDEGKNAAESEEAEDAEGAESTEGEGAKNAGPPVLVYKNNVNLEGKKNTYLVVELHLLFRDVELGKKATSDSPTAENSMIRAMILDLLSGKSLEEAMDTETREIIRKEIKEKLNEAFAPKATPPGSQKAKRPKHPVKDVLIVSWAIAQ